MGGFTYDLGSRHPKTGDFLWGNKVCKFREDWWEG